MNLVAERHLALIARLARAAEDAGVTLYWVGGPVRDALLGRAVVDIDLSVAGAGAQPMKKLTRLARKLAGPRSALRENERFLTLSFEIDETRVDLAALRMEHYDAPGALPQVEPGTLEEDLLRRDFTVNALALPLHVDAMLEVPATTEGVIDLVGGLRDIEARTLRVLHPRSFHDDPTRALRAARFSARLGFKLARTTRSALHDAIRDGAFGGVSGERLRREFERLFEEPQRGADPAVALGRLESWHVLGGLEPGLVFPRESHAPIRRLGKALAEPPWRARSHRAWVSGLCVWLSALNPGLRARTTKRLSVRGETAEKIEAFDAKAGRVARALSRSRGRGAADQILSEFDEEELFAFYGTCAAPLRRRVVRFAAEDRDRRSPVNGRDLEAAGLAGPLVGKALSRVRAAVLDGDVRNRDEALALAREVGRRRRRR